MQCEPLALTELLEQVLFSGSGVSMQSYLPSWYKLTVMGPNVLTTLAGAISFTHCTSQLEKIVGLKH